MTTQASLGAPRCRERQREAAVRLACFLAGLVALIFASVTLPVRAAEPAPGKERLALLPLAQPLWKDLSPSQRETLAPLAASWNALPLAKKRSWLSLTEKMPSMMPEDRAERVVAGPGAAVGDDLFHQVDHAFLDHRGLAGVDLGDLVRVDVHPDDLMAIARQAGERHRADVAQTEDADVHAAIRFQSTRPADALAPAAGAPIVDVRGWTIRALRAGHYVTIAGA